MGDRVAGALDELLAKDTTTLVVTHGGLFRAARRQLAGLDPGAGVPAYRPRLTVIQVPIAPGCRPTT